MTPTVRLEHPGDADAIRAVHLAAFPTAAEADLVDALRAGPAMVAGLSYVALAGSRSVDPVVGHVLLTRLRVGDADALALAPLAVMPAYQHRGLGTALMRASLAAADAAGEPLVVVVGDPAYYSRFGFVPAADLGVHTPYGDGPHVMARAHPWMPDDQVPDGEAVYSRPFADL